MLQPLFRPLRRSALMLLGGVSLLGTFQVSARELSADEALERALNALPQTAHGLSANSVTAPVCVYTGQTRVGVPGAAATPAYYVYNLAGDNGYIIASGDSRLRPLLAMSDEGTPFDPDNIPPQMSWWLGQYEAEIGAYLALNEVPVATTLSEPANVTDYYSTWTDIEPLCETRWNQGDPYNSLCPIDPSTSQRSVTGCVATAFAQILKFWSKPAVGTGSHTYHANKIDMDLTYDFDANPFEWDKMLDVYNNDNKGTTAQRNAVANLMLACGISVDMNYSSVASGAGSANVASAVAKYFGYSDQSRYYNRSNFYTVDWEKMIYTELTAGRPVYYSGSGPGGAHAFVCDGYTYAGLFHFNWGWGGSSDGWFALTALTPGTLGIGGGAGGGFSQYQDIVTIIPAGTSAEVYEGMTGQFTADAVSASVASTRVEMVCTSLYSSTITKGTFGIAAIDENGTEHYLWSTWTFDLPGYGWGWGTGTIRVDKSLFADLGAGTYIIRPATRESGTGEQSLVRVANPCQSYATLKVSASGSVTVADQVAPIKFVGLTADSEIYTDSEAPLTLAVANTGDLDWNGPMNLVMTNATTRQKYTYDLGNLFLPAGDFLNVAATIKSLDIDDKPIDAGDYKVTIANRFEKTLGNGRFDLTIRPASDNNPQLLSIFRYGAALPTILKTGALYDVDRYDMVYYFKDGKVDTDFDICLTYWHADASELDQTPLLITDVCKISAKAGSIYIYPLAKYTMPKTLAPGKYIMRYTNPDATVSYSDAMPLTVYSIQDSKYGFILNSDMTGGYICDFPNYKEHSDVVLPSTVRYRGQNYPVIGVDQGTFMLKKDLRTVVFPEDVTDLQFNAFRLDCFMDAMRFKGATVPFGTFQAVFYGLPTNTRIYVPGSALAAYRKAIPYDNIFSAYESLDMTVESVAVGKSSNVTVTLAGADADSDYQLDVQTTDPAIATVKQVASDPDAHTVTLQLTGLTIGTTTLTVASREPGVEALKADITVNDGSGIQTTDTDATLQVQVIGRTLVITVADSCQAIISDTMGHSRTVNLQPGSNNVELSASGVYIVAIPRAAAVKAVVR